MCGSQENVPHGPPTTESLINQRPQSCQCQPSDRLLLCTQQLTVAGVFLKDTKPPSSLANPSLPSRHSEMLCPSHLFLLPFWVQTCLAPCWFLQPSLPSSHFLWHMYLPLPALPYYCIFHSILVFAFQKTCTDHRSTGEFVTIHILLRSTESEYLVKKCFNQFSLTEVCLIYNVVLVSDVLQSDSVIHIYNLLLNYYLIIIIKQLVQSPVQYNIFLLVSINFLLTLNMNLMWSPGPYLPSITFSSYIQSSTYRSLVSATITLKSRVCGYPTSTSNSRDSKLNSSSFPFSTDDSSYRFYFHDKSIIHSLKLKTQKFLCFCSFTFHVQWLIIKQNFSKDLSYLFYTPIPGLRRFPGTGNSNPTQYSCLGNPMNRRAWQDTVHGVTKESDMT